MPKEVADALKEMIGPLNELLALPKDVYVNYDECGEPNAFYNPETVEITLCYELMEDIEQSFKPIMKKGAPAEALEDISTDVMVVFFFHELGHCLIDVWDIPTTGREEDTVDQLAMFILLDGSDEGGLAVLNAAIFFDLAAKQEGNEDLAFWDEHSLNKQRFYDMMCLTYGSDTEKYKGMLTAQNPLPRARAERCEEEFAKVNRTWIKLLTPYLKN